MDEYVDNNFRSQMRHPYILRVGETILPDPVKINYMEVFYRIIQALEYVHRHNIVHGYLAPESIVYTEEGYKLTNFSRAFYLIDRGSIIHERFVESDYRYLPVEVWNDGLMYDNKIDIWGMGVGMYEFITGTRLFSSDDISVLYVEVTDIYMKLDVLAEKNAPVVTILRYCLNTIKEKRPFSREMIGDVAFSGLPRDSGLPMKRRYPYPIIIRDNFSELRGECMHIIYMKYEKEIEKGFKTLLFQLMDDLINHGYTDVTTITNTALSLGMGGKNRFIDNVVVPDYPDAINPPIQGFDSTIIPLNRYVFTSMRYDSWLTYNFTEAFGKIYDIIDQENILLTNLKINDALP